MLEAFIDILNQSGWMETEPFFIPKGRRGAGVRYQSVDAGWYRTESPGQGHPGAQKPEGR